MKTKDITIIVVVALVSALFSYILAGFVFGGEDKENLKAPVVQPISTEFKAPGSNDPYFNTNSVNPTTNINIGGENNDRPF